MLPVIDFSSFASKNETNDYPRDVIDKLANACEHVGFFYAIGILFFIHIKKSQLII